VVEREIAAAEVPVFLLRAEGDDFTPSRYSVAVRDAAVAAGVDATYLEIPYPGPLGPTGGNAHSLIGVERRFMDETTAWLVSRVPAAASFVASRPARVAGNYLPLADAGRDQRLVTVGGEPMALDGRNSVDLDGGTLAYSWVQTGGRPVSLTGANTPRPAFAVPKVSTTLRFALEVRDDQGATSSDTVNVEVASLQPAGGSGSADWLMIAALLACAGAVRKAGPRLRRRPTPV
jgi:hypothetical protein